MIPAGDDTQGQPPQASVWNIANALTVLRIALVPVFAWFLLRNGGDTTSYRLIAAAVFVVATATDRIDGDIARARGLVTDFGTVSDPIADKALMGMALVGLSIIGLLPWWVTTVVLIREFGITALRFVVIRHGIMPASPGGKVKTALQAVAILLYVLPLHAFPLSGLWQTSAVAVMALAVVVTVATGVDYLLRAHKLRNTSPRAQAKRRRRAAAVRQGAALEVTALEAAAGEAAAGEAAAGEVAAAEAAAAEFAAVKLTAAELTAVKLTAAELTAVKLTAVELTAVEVAAREAARHTAGPEV